MISAGSCIDFYGHNRYLEILLSWRWRLKYLNNLCGLFLFPIKNSFLTTNHKVISLRVFEHTLKKNRYGRDRYHVSVKDQGNKYWNDNEKCLYLETVRQTEFLEKKIKDMHFSIKIIHG